MVKYNDIFDEVSEKLGAFTRNEANQGYMTAVKEVIKQHPEILTIQNKHGENLGMIACKKHDEEFAMFCLKSRVASIQRDNKGRNIGMYACMFGLENVAMKALDNPKASVQIDAKGRNIGMFCALYGLENATIKALKNKQASTQQCKGTKFNIGMYAVGSGMVRAVSEAMKNPVAREQTNARGRSLESLSDLVYRYASVFKSDDKQGDERID